MNYKCFILIFSVLIFTGFGCERAKWNKVPIEGVSTSAIISSIEVFAPITADSVNAAMEEIAVKMKWPAPHAGETGDGGLYWTISPLTLENPQFWFGEKQENEAPQIKAEKITDKARYNMYLATHSKPLTKKILNKENTKITKTLEVSKLKTTALPLGTVLCHEFTENSSFAKNLKMSVLYAPDGWRFGAFSVKSCDETLDYIKMMTEKFVK